MAGKLIRRWIALLDRAGFERTPPSLGGDQGSQILCAASGGADSTALAVLLARRGRRLGQVKALLHINHGWRGSESDQDEAFVRDLANQLGVGFVNQKGSRAPRGVSPEAHARAERKAFFHKTSLKWGAPVWTAHHLDDLAETLLWRILTGAASTHGAGIHVLEGRPVLEVRPCLTTPKSDLVDLLREEGVSWREDRTNHEGVLLRSKMRKQLGPALDELFPQWRTHLAHAALGLQEKPPASDSEATGVLVGLLANAGVRVRRAHLEAARQAQASQKRRVIALEGGLSLTHEWDARRSKSRWILE